MLKCAQSPLSRFATLAVGLFLVSAIGCQEPESAKRNSQDAIPEIPRDLADKDYSPIPNNNLNSRLNAIQILEKFNINAFILPQPRTSSIARLSSGITSCITKKLRELPISVTSDTIRVEYSLDLTNLCDESPKVDETVPEVMNIANGVIQVSCVGGGFSRLAEKKFGDIDSTICSSSDLIFYSVDMHYKARKVTRFTKEGIETLVVERAEERFSLSQVTDNPCFIKRGKTDFEISPCRVTLESFSFAGSPESESLSANDTGGPSIQLSYIDFGNMKYESGANYFNNSSVKFWINGWQGNLTYSNGWAPPRWEAQNNEEVVSGILGTTATEAL